MVKKAENLPELVRKRKGAAVLWCVQGDAAAEVGAETTVDGGGGVPEVERHEEDDAKRHGGGGGNDPSVLVIRRSEKWQVRESRSPKNG